MSKSLQKKLGHITIGLSSLAVVTVAQMTRADAASIMFSGTGIDNSSGGSGEALGALATFSDALNPGKFTIQLQNTGPATIDPSDVLTALFWDYTGSSSLSNLSLNSVTGSTVVSNDGANIQSNVNLTSINEWKLPNSTTSNATLISGITQHYGLGTAGLNIFQGGGGQQFNYGIIDGYSSKANPAVKGGTFVDNLATFVLSGLPSGFDVTKISNVRFQFGTSLSEPSIAVASGTVTPSPAPAPSYTSPPAPYYTPTPTPTPVKEVSEPGTTAALLFTGLTALGYRKRQKQAEQAW